MSILKEFREFAVRGNVLDLAVGVVIGAGFGKIVASAVSDIIMPPLGLVVGGVNFTDIKVALKAPALDAAGKAIPAVTMNVGNFLQSVVDFSIVALAVFLVVKGANAIQKAASHEKTTAPAEPPADVKLLTEIRDLLKKG
jgi:large conductance mechanosensitive channel